MYNDITPETRQYLRTIILGIVEGDSIVKVYQVKNALFNKATTVNETTIICCIIVERYLMHSKRTYIDNFKIPQERDNIIIPVLETILTGKKLYLEEANSEDVGSHKSWKLRRKREEESYEERQNRLRKDKEMKHFSRESSDEREIHRSRERSRYEKATNRRKNSIYLKGRQTDDDLKEHRLNPMETICIHCGALHFSEEATARSNNSFNDCCRSVIYL
jgi:hypothetical protein